jgi:hypothetical protein
MHAHQVLQIRGGHHLGCRGTLEVREASGNSLPLVFSTSASLVLARSATDRRRRWHNMQSAVSSAYHRAIGHHRLRLIILERGTVVVDVLRHRQRRRMSHHRLTVDVVD